MKEKETITATINVGVREDGRVFIDTKEEYIPTKIAQEIMDKVISQLVFDGCDKALIERCKEKTKEAKMWKYIAYGQLIITVIIYILLKVKGVL